MKEQFGQDSPVFQQRILVESLFTAVLLALNGQRWDVMGIEADLHCYQIPFQKALHGQSRSQLSAIKKKV